MMNTNKNRQIVLDTETTGINQSGMPHYKGHKIVEIAAVEIVNRRVTKNFFQAYINPMRVVDPEAVAIHGLTDDFLKDKPLFSEIAHSFFDFIQDSDLIIHNAPFDVGFINYELQLCDTSAYLPIEQDRTIIDTLMMARKLFPGKRNNLNALCERFQIDNSHRTLHGALLDAEILADVYLLMTGGQTSMSFLREEINAIEGQSAAAHSSMIPQNLHVILANQEEIAQHEALLALIGQQNKHPIKW